MAKRKPEEVMVDPIDSAEAAATAAAKLRRASRSRAKAATAAAAPEIAGPSLALADDAAIALAPADAAIASTETPNVSLAPASEDAALALAADVAPTLSGDETAEALEAAPLDAATALTVPLLDLTPPPDLPAISDTPLDAEGLALAASANLAPLAADTSPATIVVDAAAEVAPPAGHGSILANYESLGAISDDELALKTPPAYQIAALTARAEPAPRHGLRLGAFVLVACLAAAAGVVSSQFLPVNGALADQTEALAADATRLRGQIASLNVDMASLTGTVRTLGTSVETIGATLETTDQNMKAQAADFAAQLARQQAADADRIAAIAGLDVRLERLEQPAVSQVATTRAFNPGVDTAAVTGAIPAARPGAAAGVRAEVIDGWVVLDVSRGRALVEGRRFGLFDVAPGSQLPGVGPVQRIERQEGRWVVVTAAGIIPELQQQQPRPF